MGPHDIDKNGTDGHLVAIVAFGNPLLDLSIAVNDDTLTTQYGLPVDGQVEVVGVQHDLFPHVLINYTVEETAGGSAQNTLRIFQRLTEEDKLACYIIGKIGRDQVGQHLQDRMSDDGVLTRYVYDEKLGTGCCVAIVRGANRCLAANIGAASGLLVQHFDQVDGFSLFSRTRLLYVEGFVSTHSLEAALQAIRFTHALPNNQIRLVSLSATYVCHQFHHHFRKLLPYANLVIGNEDEFRALAASWGREDANDAVAADIARSIAGSDYISPTHRKRKTLMADFFAHNDNADNKLDWLSLDERLVVMTRGSSCVICSTNSQTWEFAVKQMGVEEIKDTTGAGDAFLAGFLYRLLAGCALEECVATAIETAQIVIAQTGCQYP